MLTANSLLGFIHKRQPEPMHKVLLPFAQEYSPVKTDEKVFIFVMFVKYR